MRASVIIAIAVGALISSSLLGLEWLSRDADALLSWQMPGISAAYLFWGAVGGSAFAGIAIAWLVNALVYGAGALVALILPRLLMFALPKASNG